MIKKDFLISTSEDLWNVTADFKNGDEKVKTFLKGEQILLLIREFYRKIRRTLIISYSNKMLPLLNASKAYQAIPTGSLKKRQPSKKHTKTVKSRRWNNFIVKLQNWKLTLLSSEPTKRKLMWKISQSKLNQTFSLEKFETKAIKISVLGC